jgi:uncharacterized protein
MQYALVSGGSKGIGYGVATALAKRGFNLILVARNTEALETAKKKLESEYPINVEILSFDLALEDAAAAIGKWCNEKEIPLKMLCNVTGIGGDKDYLSIPLADSGYMFRLNTEPAINLSYHLLSLLKKYL